MRRVITTNVLISCLLLLVVEIIGQLYYRWTDGAFLAQRYERYVREAQAQTTVFEQHPYLVARPRSNVSIEGGAARISTTSIHTRVTSSSSPKPDAIKVAVVGGSTTFGTKVTDSDTWPWLLQETLGDEYAVINYGVPGYSTAEAIIQMALIVPEEKPKIVVFYQGWNDLRSYHWSGFGADYYAHGMSQFDTLIPKVDQRATFWTKATHYSFVMGLLNRSLGTPVGAQTRPSDRTDPEVDRIYQRNLHTLKVLARNFGMTAIFVPQVLNDDNYSKKGVSRSWTPYIEDAAVPALLRGLSGLMSEVCSPDERDCQFVGETLTERWNGNDFVDEGHFSRQGGEKFAAILAARIRVLK